MITSHYLHLQNTIGSFSKRIVRVFSLIFSLLLKMSLLASLCLLTLRAQAQIERSTTFDDRKVCEESNGIWHDFGDECGDLCDQKFEKNPVCTKRIFFGCDCGAKRCFNGKQCVRIQDYWQEYEAKKIANQAEIEEAKQKRAKQYLAIQRLRASRIPEAIVKQNAQREKEEEKLAEIEAKKNEEVELVEAKNGDELEKKPLDQLSKMGQKFFNSNSGNLNDGDSSKPSDDPNSPAKNSQKVEIIDLLKDQQEKKNLDNNQSQESYSDNLIKNLENKIGDIRNNSNSSFGLNNLNPFNVNPTDSKVSNQSKDLNLFKID